MAIGLLAAGTDMLQIAVLALNARHLVYAPRKKLA
jgi:predicted branched-subunit amino acid permease